MWPFKKKKSEIKPVDDLTSQEIKNMRAESETEAVIAPNKPKVEFVPPEYTMAQIVDFINSRDISIRLLLKVMYCILWHHDRRISVLEAPKKE